MGCELELPWVDPKDPNYESDGDENIVNDAPAHVPTKNGGQPHGQNGNIKSHAHGTTLKTMVPEMSEEDVNRGKGRKLIDWLTSIISHDVCSCFKQLIVV